MLLRLPFMTAVAAALAGCAAPHVGREPLPAAFVVLGEGGAPIARALTTAHDCPVIEIDGHVAQMAVRAPWSAIALRPRADGLAPASNPILACETRLPPGSRHVVVDGAALPLPRSDMRRIVVIGDTGCRIKGFEAQACNDADAYPFARVAASAAAWKPDLVIHVGDYHYREDPCPAGRAGCAGSAWGYGWDAWNADFFAPARALFAAAPWVLVRGNHETCARAGQGWWRFLDPHPWRPDAACDDPAADAAGDYTTPYAVPLGPAMQLLVFDSANTTYKGFAPGDPRLARYVDTRRQLDALARGTTHGIAAGHHPLYAFGAERTAAGVHLFGGDAGLVQAFGAVDARLLPPSVDALLSGHVHLWEQVSFDSDHPSQFVSGFSGTAEDTVPLPSPLPQGAEPAPGARVAAMRSWLEGFGFMTMERTGDDRWTVIVHDRDGRAHDTCELAGRRSRCVGVGAAGSR
jgi:hypothetical protein